MSSIVSNILLAIVLTTGATTAQQAPSPPPSKSPDAPGQTTARPAALVANIKLDLTITDQREGVTTQPKLVALVVADRESGRIRTGNGDVVLNVDAQPEILSNGRVRVFVSLEYRPLRAEGEKNNVSMLTQMISSILEDGKSMVVSQSAEPGSNRSVKLEVRASIQK